MAQIIGQESGSVKTTLEIDDELYREAKAHASLTGRKMKDLVAEGLRLAIRPAARVTGPAAAAASRELAACFAEADQLMQAAPRGPIAREHLNKGRNRHEKPGEGLPWMPVFVGCALVSWDKEHLQRAGALTPDDWLVANPLPGLTASKPRRYACWKPLPNPLQTKAFQPDFAAAPITPGPFADADGLLMALAMAIVGKLADPLAFGIDAPYWNRARTFNPDRILDLTFCALEWSELTLENPVVTQCF